MSLLVDTSVWSLALRRTTAPEDSQISQLRDALEGADTVVTTGLILQELLQGFNGPKDAAIIAARFQALALVGV